ncbi:MAG: helix-turn-helix transcriptional regulator [Oscillospiraceae bacterium]|nr:helix-turn-helix transcriptional regulator [Oscillospiraceae bacterium]
MRGLKRVREAAKMTQTELADKIGVKPNAVSQYESGVRAPRAALLPKIAQVLGCTVDELLQEQ